MITTWDVKRWQEEGKVKALGKLPELIEALADNENEDVRACSAEALGLLGDPSAIEPLIKTILKDNPLVMKAAGLALSKFGTPAIRSILTLFQDNGFCRNNEYSLLKLVDVMPLIGGNEAVQAIIGLLDHRYIQDRAAQVLSEIGDPAAVEPLVARIIHSNGWLKEQFIRALGRLPDARSILPLIAAYKANKERGKETDGLGQFICRGIVIDVLAETMADAKIFAELTETERSQAVEGLMDIYFMAEAHESHGSIMAALKGLSVFYEMGDKERARLAEIDQHFQELQIRQAKRLPPLPGTDDW